MKNVTKYLDKEAHEFLGLQDCRYKGLVSVCTHNWIGADHNEWEFVEFRFPWHWNTRLSEPSGWCYSIGAKIARKWATYKRKRIDLDALKQDLEVVAQEVKDYLEK